MNPERLVRSDIRIAHRSDAADIAAAHLDSIRSIGPCFYPLDTVSEWARAVAASRYVDAMNHGEVFFVAEGEIDGKPAVIGFATHRVDEGVHGTAVYVRGLAARKGIGSALYRLAEADAIAKGATSIEIDASLAAVEFYRALGFEDLGRGTHHLSSGAAMQCVFMRKILSGRG